MTITIIVSWAKQVIRPNKQKPKINFKRQTRFSLIAALFKLQQVGTLYDEMIMMMRKEKKISKRRRRYR